MRKPINYIILLGCGILIGSVFPIRKPEVQRVGYPVHHTVTEVDTVYVTVPPEIQYVTQTVHDTVYVETPQEDEFYVISSTQMDLVDNGVRYGDLYIEYTHPPWDEFTFTFNPAPLPTRVVKMPVTQYTEREAYWYEHPLLHFTIGAAMGSVVTKYYADH